MKKQLLDVDASGGTSEDCANGINFSMKKVDPVEERKKVDGQMTDAGGGGWVKVLKVHSLKLNAPKLTKILKNEALTLMQLAVYTHIT